MSRRPSLRVSLHRQRGAALMLMLLVAVLGAAALFARGLAMRSSAIEEMESSTASLAVAREALLGYAVSYEASNGGQYGLLPCPDVNAAVNAEGAADPATAQCGAQYRSAMGRLPWRTLGIAPARVESGECLWYVVSGTWKASTASQSTLINTDSNGQLRVFSADGATLIAGANPAERAVALIIAPNRALAGQTRLPLGAGVDQCSGNYTAAGYLDNDTVAGINNRTLTAAADAIDDFIAGSPDNALVNDQIAVITRADIENRLRRHQGLAADLVALTDAVARCVAEWARHNAGGPADRRLPWPAPVDLNQYRTAAQYNDDGFSGALSGRVPDVVDNSMASTGNTFATALTACPAAVVEWTPERRTLWGQWKDHFFYAVADSFRPTAPAPSICGPCLTVNGGAPMAAVVMFAGARVAGQVRDEPPLDPDTRGAIDEYLEGRNATNHPNALGNGDYENVTPATATFNDILFCIAPDLMVNPC